MAVLSGKPVQLPEELGMYVDELRQQCSSLDQIWVLDSRIDAPVRADGTWQLLAFGDAAALRMIRSQTALHRSDLDLFVVTDGVTFEAAWGERRRGRLADVHWQLRDPQTATYVPPIEDSAPNADRCLAVRVR